MIHSITFGNGMNTYDDFGMMAVERLVFASPAVKTNYVDITGSDNSLDLSEVLTGYPTYEERKGSFKFRFIDNGEPVRDRLTRLMNTVHGKRLTAILSEEPDYYYDVRWQVSDADYKKVGEFADVELDYIAKAYKYELAERSCRKIFGFTYTQAGEYQSSNASIVVHGTPKPTCPKITIHTAGIIGSNDGIPELSVDFDGVSYQLSLTGFTFPRSFIFPQIMLHDGTYEFEFSLTPNSNNPVDGITFDLSIDFQGGFL